MRIYVPATVSLLRELVGKTELAAPSDTAFALTPALRESYLAGDTEELEYVALLEAARASLRLLSVSADEPRRRAVIAADVDGATPRADLDVAVVRLPGPFPFSSVAAVHMDIEDAQQAVAEAVEVIDVADLGDEDAEFVIGTVEDHELAWYAPQEIPFVLDLL